MDVKPGGQPNEAADLRTIRAYTAAVEGKPLHIVRGDFHRHTELSWDGGGTNDGSLQDFYRYMIDVAALDFGASTDHQGGAWHLLVVVLAEDDRHVSCPWRLHADLRLRAERRLSERPPPTSSTPGAPNRASCRSFSKKGAEGFGLPLTAQGDEPGVGSGELAANDTKMLYEEIRGRNGISIPHTSSTRMGTDWRDNDAKLEPVVEIYQGARANSESLDAPFVVKAPKDQGLMTLAGYQPEGMVSNAWAKGYKLGIITSSDHGSTHISYAMVYTADPQPARRCWTPSANAIPTARWTTSSWTSTWASTLWAMSSRSPPPSH